MKEEIKVNDKVRVKFTSVKGRITIDTGRIAFFTKDGLLAVEMDNLEPKIWYARIEDCVKI